MGFRYNSFTSKVAVLQSIDNLYYRSSFFFFLIGFSFTTIYESLDCRWRGRVFPWLLTTTSTRFTDTYKLARRLLQRAHLCIQVAAELESGTFGFRAQVANHQAPCCHLCCHLCIIHCCHLMSWNYNTASSIFQIRTPSKPDFLCADSLDM